MNMPWKESWMRELSWCSALWLVVCVAVSAEANPTPACTNDCVAVGEWQLNLAVGLGARANPLVDGETTPLVILPEISYYGRRIFLRNFELGFTLLETPRQQLNLLATPSYDQMYFNRWDPLNLTFEGGGASGAAAIAAPPRSYTQINVRAAPRPASGDSAAPPEAEDPGGLDPGEVPEPPQGPTAEAPSFSGSITSDFALEINGQLITTDSRIVSADGGVIEVRFEGGGITIDGIGTTDQMNLRSEGDLELRDFSGDVVVAHGGETRSSVINIDPEADRFVLNPQSDSLQPSAPPEHVAYNAVSKRRVSGLAGLEYSYNARWVSVHAQALQDVTGVHNGHELRLALVVPLNLATQKLAFTVGANMKSRNVLDYYYGIESAATDDSPWRYSVDSGGIETLLRVDWQKPLGKGWSLRAKMQYLDLPSAMTQSPLVAKDYVLSAFVGGVYHF